MWAWFRYVAQGLYYFELMFWLTVGSISRTSVGSLLANVEWIKPERD
jgi:hypothetical protein